LTAAGNLKTAVLEALPAGEAHIGALGGAIAIVSAELTRPANTSAYTIGDVVSDSTVASTLLTFTGAARVTGGSGYITKVRLETNQSTNVAQMRLWLYTINNPTVVADNVPMTLLYTNKANRIGYIDIPSCATEMAGSDSAQAQDGTIRFAFRCGADANLYGLLETKTAFTPTSNQKFFVELTVDQN
jgi:hypothetical protein